MNVTFYIIRKYEPIKWGYLNAMVCQINITIPSTETKTAMMRDTPATFMDCAAVYKSGNTDSGVYTLTLPNTTTEVKVK